MSYLTEAIAAAPDTTPDGLVLGAIAVSIAISAACGAVIFRATRTRSLITPAYLFFVYYVVFVLIGGVMLVWNRGEGTYFHYLGTRNWVFLVTITAGLPAFTAGVLAANRLARFEPGGALRQAMRGPWRDALPSGATRALLAVLAVLCLAVSYVVLFLGPVAPLLLLLRNRSNHSVAFDYTLDYARLAYISPHAGALPFQATLYQFYGNLLPLLAALAAGWWAASRRRWALPAALALGLVALVMAGATLSKNPVENLLILWFLGWLTYRARAVQWWQALSISGAAVAVFFTIVLVTNRSATLPAIVAGTFRRLFLVQVQVLYSIFELFPRHTPFLLGGGLFMDLRNLKPGPKATLDFGTWLYSVIVSNQPGLGGVGSAPAAFFGQLYADLGVPGALAGLFAVGIGAQLAYIWYLRAPRSLVNWCVFVGLTASIPRLTTSSLVSIGFQYGIIASILFGVYFGLGRFYPRRQPAAEGPAPARAADRPTG